MTAPSTPELRPDEPWYGIRARFLRAFILGTIGYVLVVGIVLGTMWILVDRLSKAKSEYDSVNDQLRAAQAGLEVTRAQSAQLQSLSEELTKKLADLQGQLTALQGQYDAVLKQKQEADKAVSDAQAKIADLQTRLNQIYDFKPHIVPISEIDEKMAYGALGERGFRIFQMAIQDAHRKLPFGAANNPEGGFTSPGYAQYLLGKIGITQPVSALKPRAGPPKNGDIITYQPAYYMFYFSIPNAHKEFVIGMTTEGVLALDLNFGTRMGIFATLSP